MKVFTPQSGAGKTLALSSRPSGKTYTPRKAPMPSLSAYRAAEKTIPGLTGLKRKHNESVEQDYESDSDQEDGDSDIFEEEEGQEEEDDSGSGDDDGEVEKDTSSCAEIKQDFETSSDSDSSSSDSETGPGAASRSESSENEPTYQTLSLNKELFGEDDAVQPPEDGSAAVAYRKRKSLGESHDHRKAARLMQTPPQLPPNDSKVQGSSNVCHPKGGNLAKKRSGAKAKSQAEDTGRYNPQSLQDWALPVDAETKFVDGSPYRPVPKNEQMVARCQEAKVDRLHPTQLAEWLKIHGIAMARKSHPELLQLVRKIIDDHTGMRPGDLLPAGYTSIQDVTGISHPSVKPKSAAAADQGSAISTGSSNTFVSRTPSQSETSSTRQVPVNTSQDQQPMPSSITSASGESPSTGRLVSIQITPAVPAVHYAHRTNEVAGIAWFKQRDVPPLPYVPGQSADIDMKVHRVKYGYVQDDVWSSPKYQDITTRDIVEAIPPDELEAFDSSQLRGYLRSTGNANVKATSTEDECKKMILLDVRIHRGLVILGLEHRAQRQGQQVALQVPRYPEQNGVVDLTGVDDED